MFTKAAMTMIAMTTVPPKKARLEIPSLGTLQTVTKPLQYIERSLDGISD